MSVQSTPANFGRRSQPHQFIVARGERVRSFTLPSWATWTGVCAVVGAALWLVGSTVYIAFTDEIYEAAKAHRVNVERAYEDRIAALRRQIDEINTRKFLDQQAFETRLNTLLNRQAMLEQRHQDIAGLLGEARDRKLAIPLNPASEPDSAMGGPLPVVGPVVEPAGGASFDPSRPAPLDAEPAARPDKSAARSSETPFPFSLASAARASSRHDLSQEEIVEEIQASLDRVASLQGSVLNSLETTVGDLSDRLVEVSEAVGAKLPKAAMEDPGLGGPLVELRRSDATAFRDRQVDRIRDDIERFDMLRTHVNRLPVRTPLAGALEFTSSFGRRLDPFLKRPAMHSGIDLRAGTGTPVHAAGGGLVTIAGYSGGYGRLVEIDHGGGYRTRYGHLSRIVVKPGGNVAPGDVIGMVGSSGRSTGPHLHYETRVYGAASNPKPFIEASQLVPEGL